MLDSGEGDWLMRKETLQPVAAGKDREWRVDG